ncbi:Transglycosylase [Chryseobacterium ureilyticum]|uniref:Transglycosylase n=1 Tax=Chryseobacterium ureilyticum TaxID=373668 RepID=A0A1N7PGX9_9FLAO|nr:transglycosylase domain-containing protein [Chryseobacterium ureilyticum]SIT09874.1 Transglycosylase [Chryseobacterium ureilyticum]
MKYLKISLLAIGCTFIISILYIEFGGKFRLNKENKKIITWHIRTSKKSPDNFKNFYNTVYLNTLSKNSWNLYIQQLINSSDIDQACPCHTMSNRLMPTFDIKNKSSLDYFLVIRYIEQNYNQEDCLNFNFSNFDFLYGRKGIDQVSRSLFSKPATELQSIEMAEILALYENPIKNNRYGNPERARARATYFYNLYLSNLKKIK